MTARRIQNLGRCLAVVLMALVLVDCGPPRHVHRTIVSDGKVIADGDAVSILQNETVRQVYLGQDFRL